MEFKVAMKMVTKSKMLKRRSEDIHGENATNTEDKDNNNGDHNIYYPLVDRVKMKTEDTYDERVQYR